MLLTRSLSYQFSHLGLRRSLQSSLFIDTEGLWSRGMSWRIASPVSPCKAVMGPPSLRKVPCMKALHVLLGALRGQRFSHALQRPKSRHSNRGRCNERRHVPIQWMPTWRVSEAEKHYGKSTCVRANHPGMPHPCHSASRGILAITMSPASIPASARSYLHGTLHA